MRRGLGVAVGISFPHADVNGRLLGMWMSSDLAAGGLGASMDW